MLKIALVLFVATAFAYEVYLCLKIEAQLSRIEKLVEEEMNADGKRTGMA